MDRRRGPADGAGMLSDRPARGSLAELRLRLERLPAGHPSSPYDETGARRPAPEQLRQLELPLSDEDEHHPRPGLLASAPSVPADQDRGELRPAGLAGYRPGDDGGNGLSGANGLSGGNGLSGNGSGPPAYRQAASYPQDAFDPAGRDAEDDELTEPGRDEDLGAGEYDDSPYSSGRYASGRDRDDHDQSRPHQAEPDQGEHYQPEYHEPEFHQPEHFQPEHFQPAHGQPDHYQAEHDPSDHDPSDHHQADHHQADHNQAEHDRFGSGPAGNGRNGIGAPVARDEADGSGSARLAAFGQPPGNGARPPGDLAGGEPLPQAPDAAASALPSRNGSGQRDEPAFSGRMPRVTDAGPRPARNGFRDHDDPAAPDPGPRVPAAAEDVLAARNGSGRPLRGPASGPLPSRMAGDLMSPSGGGRDNPFRDDRPGPDPAPGQNGHPPRRTGLGELERTRTMDRDRPAGQRHAGLTAEQEAIADQALSRYKDADGRNVFGGYGESGLTPAIRRVEAQLPHGRLAPDSDQHALKSAGRFKDKLARMITRHPGIPPAELAAEIYDAARYAFVFEPQDYTDGTWLVHRRLKTQGFDLEARRNRWDTPEFKGIRTRWRDPAHDLPFEVQFHTPASWDVVQRTYDAYVRITDPRTPAAERSQLRERQVAAAAGTPLPARYAEIGDFRADIR